MSCRVLELEISLALCLEFFHRMALVSTCRTTNLQWTTASLDEKITLGGAVGLAGYSILTEAQVIIFELQNPPSLKMLIGLVLAFTDGVLRMGCAWQLLVVSLVSFAVGTGIPLTGDKALAGIIGFSMFRMACKTRCGHFPFKLNILLAL